MHPALARLGAARERPMAGNTAVLEYCLAPLRAHLAPADVTELVINRPGEFGIETESGWTWVDDPELTEDRLRPLAIAAAAVTTQDVTRDAPICSTVLPSG